MYTIHVSHNCGVSYKPAHSAETLEELEEEMQKLDESWLRWYVDKNGEDDFSATCAIHKGIVEFMDNARGNNHEISS